MNRRFFVDGVEVRGFTYEEQINVEDGATEVHLTIDHFPRTLAGHEQHTVLVTVGAATTQEAVGVVWVALRDYMDDHRFRVEPVNVAGETDQP